MRRRSIIVMLVLAALIGTATANNADVARQEVADALADPSAAFERYLTQRLGEANATLARAFARGSASASASASATDTGMSTSPLLSAAAATDVASSLPPSLRVLVPAMSSGAERARRQAIFRTNVRRAAALNAAALRAARGKSAADVPVYGLTDFSHLTKEEFRRLYLSKPFSQLKDRVDMSDAEADSADDNGDDNVGAGARRRRRRLAQSAGARLQCRKKLRTFPYSRVKTPATFDWRDVNGTSYVTPVRDQQACGSCASFATVVTLEAVSIARTLANRRAQGASAAGEGGGTPVSEAVDLAEQDFLDCWDPATNECDGAMPSWYIDRAVCRGIASEHDVPYVARDGNACPGVARDTLGLKGWYQPPSTDKGVKQAVLKAPVVIAIMAEDSFSMYRGGVLPCGTPGGGKGVNHAVSVVGWDAASFIVKNSWGAYWGDAGYVRLASGCAKNQSALNMLTPGYNVGVKF